MNDQYQNQEQDRRIKELEKKGIGRPSTYATIMSKITDRSYAIKTKDIFVPTELGRKIIAELVKFFTFMQYEYTADMEEQLDKIERGELSYLQMLNNFFPTFKEQVHQAYVSREKDYGINCDICNKAMRLRHGFYGYYMACTDYPKCKSSKSCNIVDGLPVIKEFVVNVAEGVSCPKCNGPMMVKDGKFGKFYSCINYPKCRGNGKIPYGKKCSKCGVGELFATLIAGKSKLCCMRYPDCKNVEELPEEHSVNWIYPQDLKLKGTYKIVEDTVNRRTQRGLIRKTRPAKKTTKK